MPEPAVLTACAKWILTCQTSCKFVTWWRGIRGGTTGEVFQEWCFLCERGASFAADFDLFYLKNLASKKPPLSIEWRGAYETTLLWLNTFFKINMCKCWIWQTIYQQQIMIRTSPETLKMHLCHYTLVWTKLRCLLTTVSTLISSRLLFVSHTVCQICTWSV